MVRLRNVRAALGFAALMTAAHGCGKAPGDVNARAAGGSGSTPLHTPALDAAARDATASESVEVTLERCQARVPEAFASVGAIGAVRAIGDPHGEHPIVEVTGTTHRAYVVLRAQDDPPCNVAVVDGKPAAFAIGHFGGAATHAYALATQGCGMPCATLVSLTADDGHLIDLHEVRDWCRERVELSTLSLFEDHDSLLLACWGVSGPDFHKSDEVLDASMGQLHVLLALDAGWSVQLESKCRAPVPDYIKVVTRGPSPVIETRKRATAEQTGAALNRGELADAPGDCNELASIERWRFDGTKLVADGAERLAVVHQRCDCK
jgi:hypothetical protein